MRINHLNSVSSLKPEDVIPTFARPVRVLCNDLNYYVVKHSKIGFSQLFNEYITACFAKIWDLNIPEFAFVKVKTTHVPMGLHPDIQPFHFRETCFGLKYNRNYSEVDRILENASQHQRKLFIEKKDLLKIALFDLWLANEDRNHNNYNLLFDIDSNNKFVIIDHQAVFNYDSLEDGLSQLTHSDSLLYTPLVSSLFTKKEITSNIATLEKKYYLCITKCKNQFVSILKQVPKDWKLDLGKLEKQITENIFAEKWIEETWNSFISYAQALINKK